MTGTVAWVKTSDGQELYSRFWSTTSAPIATVVFVHGLGEHIDRYEHVFTAFSQKGIEVYAWDQRGFGETGKKAKALGQHGSFQKMLQDIDEALSKHKKEGVPLVLMGHSMGGMEVLNYATSSPTDYPSLKLLSGVISSAAAITTPIAPPAPVVLVLRGLSALLPSIPYKIEVPAKYISRDLEEVRKYEADPLVHPIAALSLARDLYFQGIHLIKPDVPSKIVSCPIYIAHGTGDKVTNYSGSKQFYDMLPGDQKTFKTYEGYYHELHNEPVPDREGVIADYIQWIEERAKSAQ